MHHRISFSHKLTIAFFTDKRFLFDMAPVMSLEIGWVVEWLPTDTARIRLLAGVDKKMSPKFRGSRKNFIANVTLVHL